MPVVINDFEVVAEPSPPPKQAAAQAAGESQPGQLDIERLLAPGHARELRVRAY